MERRHWKEVREGATHEKGKWEEVRGDWEVVQCKKGENMKECVVSFTWERRRAEYEGHRKVL